MLNFHKRHTHTPASNLAYLASPRTRSDRCQIVYRDPLNVKQSCSKNKLVLAMSKCRFPPCLLYVKCKFGVTFVRS